jgi:hypothetical protein
LTLSKLFLPAQSIVVGVDTKERVWWLVPFTFLLEKENCFVQFRTRDKDHSIPRPGTRTHFIVTGIVVLVHIRHRIDMGLTETKTNSALTGTQVC